MRIHLGHHFYGAGNLGDDFMLAGFLAAMRDIVPHATFTCCVPFPLAPLLSRFPEIQWHAYDPALRKKCIEECDAWLGLGGSPFQHALSRWFIDHLIEDSALCREAHKPMHYLGIGVQSSTELDAPEVRRLCAEATAIWTRDPGSAERLAATTPGVPIHAASDLAHICFRACPPPPAKPGRLTFVPNFDYQTWPGQTAFLNATRELSCAEKIWLAQESRDLPGSEKALFASLPSADQATWRLVAPEAPGSPLADVLRTWPSGDWLITARYHAALAGAWSGSKIVALATNEKLHAAARQLRCASIDANASAREVRQAVEQSRVPARPTEEADAAYAACVAFVNAATGRSAVAHTR